MAGAVFGVIMILGCLIGSTCVIVIAFTIVETRRTATELLRLFELRADRNYTMMADTNAIAKRIELKIDAIEDRIVTPDPDA